MKIEKQIQTKKGENAIANTKNIPTGLMDAHGRYKMCEHSYYIVTHMHAAQDTLGDGSAALEHSAG